MTDKGASKKPTSASTGPDIDRSWWTRAPRLNFYQTAHRQEELMRNSIGARLVNAIQFGTAMDRMKRLTPNK